MNSAFVRSSAVLIVAASSSLFEEAAFAQELRFTDTVPGNVIALGNTLGLSKEISFNGPGTSDAIGTFITLDGTSLDADAPLGSAAWPLGTTSNWQANGSTANFALPLEAQVLYAELVWGGSYQYGTEDVSASLDTSVTLSFGADSISVNPDPATSTTVAQTGTFTIRYYMRSAEVTAFVAQHGSGTYAVEGVPGTQAANVNQTNAAGWSLVTAYRYDGEPIRNLSVFVGDTKFVDENTTVDYSVSGFCAPPAGEIEGTIAISTVEGDSNRVGDQLAIGETIASSFVSLSGPNNPADNFFCSQINGPSGALDTSGSFGSANHTPGSNTSGARQGWDVTHVQLSSASGQLVPGQTSAVLRTQTLDDSYMPVLAGISIDVNAPTFVYQASTTETDTNSVTLGDTFEITVTLVNEGSATAQNVTFTLPLASGLGMLDFATNGSPGDINGAAVVQGDLATGVDMGDVAPGQQRVVTLHVSVDAPQTQTILVLPVWHYAYTMCVGSSTNESFSGQAVGVSYVEEPGTGGGGPGGGGVGGAGEGGDGTSEGGSPLSGPGGASTTGGSSSQGGEGGGSGVDTTPEDGCGCDVASSGRDGGVGALFALGGLATLLKSRSRRRLGRHQVKRDEQDPAVSEGPASLGVGRAGVSDKHSRARR